MLTPSEPSSHGLRLRHFAAALVALGLASCSGDATRFDANPFRDRPETTASLSQKSGSWSWDGGIPLTLAPGDTLEGVAHRYHVPVSAIIQVNNLTGPNAIRAGQHLVVPRYYPEPVLRSASAPVHGMAAATPPKADLVINKRPAEATTLGANLPEKRPRHGASAIRIAKVVPIPKPNRRRMSAQGLPRQPDMSGRLDAGDRVGSVKPDDITPNFEWPARGRILRRFGPQPGGQQDDGIDVAVPEDTPIKAASDGTVIYAGNVLKSLGNLVLVRHTDNYVTAYAHAKELRVKRGDPIKQGDVIGISGRTEEVDTPQFHFEIRKDSAPVDPLNFLHGV
jgi:murein DD-endopeptidase MepM/ murein hydrolase activator NlpD